MSSKTIYDALRAAGMTAEGACGLLGNMMAESSMKANIAQRGMTSLSDEAYTAAADAGRIPFSTDGVGYGLVQHTYHTRKAALMSFAKAHGVSVGDEAMQVQFIIQEMRSDYPGVWKVLTESHDLYECTRIVCVQYERPAVNNIDARYRFARDFFEQLAGGSEDPDPAPEQAPEPQPEPGPTPSPASFDWKVALMQWIMKQDGFWDGECDGIKTPEYRQAIQEYAAAVASC